MKTEDKQFSSKDFHETFARPTLIMPERLIHKNIEQAGEHNQFSAERKRPVFLWIYPLNPVMARFLRDKK